jgi:hypothetical protein
MEAELAVVIQHVPTEDQYIVFATDTLTVTAATEESMELMDVGACLPLSLRPWRWRLSQLHRRCHLSHPSQSGPCRLLSPSLTPASRSVLASPSLKSRFTHLIPHLLAAVLL